MMILRGSAMIETHLLPTIRIMIHHHNQLLPLGGMAIMVKMDMMKRTGRNGMMIMVTMNFSHLGSREVSLYIV